ncbi:neuroendocrine protein 7B2 [Nilaparvata lugens]|uniref:neuroendocrine protein 7B2 n=1 Tax=Nilaparvata lugens TaxID=108931 RepID=UPI000B98D520|nr:neuroendocrine protein 7B2 [Nilaparvata lugens]
MGVVTLLAIAASVVGAIAYMPSGNEHLLTDSLLREVVDRMGHDLAESYLDYPSGGGGGGSRLSAMSALMSRADKEMMDDAPFYPDSPSPSLRDQEYIQHSTLWGHHYLSGGNGEGSHRISFGGNGGGTAKVKSDASLPAYCNPPNPCPLGFAGEDGCLEQYDNTAAFSRDYQAAQDCMCDSEHMFDCERKAQPNALDDQLADYDMPIDNQHKGLVAKKFHVKKDSNPFLQGEKLPIAAKKGINVEY